MSIETVSNPQELKSSYFISENLLSTEEHWSESKKYRLEIGKYKTKPKCWEYTQGKVYGADLIATVQRNYHRFWFKFIENHSNSHDYLLGGEDYQGQTIIELDTGKRIDLLPTTFSLGAGFCWTKVTPNSTGTYLAVTGCFWGAPYQVNVYDFSDPLNFISKPLFASEYEEFNWIDDETLSVRREVEYSLLHNKFYRDLTEEEQDLVDQKFDETKSTKGVTEYREEEVIWEIK